MHAVGVLTLATAVALAFPPAAAIAQTLNLSATLSPLSGTVQGKETVQANFLVDVDASRICYQIKLAPTRGLVMSYLHKGLPGSGVTAVGKLGASGHSAPTNGCAKLDPALVKDVFDNPGAYCVNVATPEAGGGYMRGQLQR